MSATSDQTKQGWTLLERDQRFSQSLLWTIQRTYYDQSGPNAWHSGQVPNYSTCNTFIAQAYAEVVMAYARELARTDKLSTDAPLYIVELAAGVGRFAAHFLRKLTELKNESSLRCLDIRYVMTDFTRTNIDVWRKHPHLQQFVDAGILNFGKFDVDSDDTVQFIDGSTLSSERAVNPLVVFANYAFDTFRHDIFRIQNGKLHEVRVTTQGPGSGPVDLTRTEVLSKLRMQYSHREIDATRYYEDPILNEVLAYYQEHLTDTSVSIPIGSLRGLSQLSRVSGGRMMLLTSDKGFTHEDELYHPNPQSMQLHTGCFSLMVNYHAIGSYFTRLGGLYAATSRRHMSLKTAMCLLGGKPDEHVDTMSMFRKRIEDFGPGVYFDFLQQTRKAKQHLSLPHFLGLLRLSGHDPGVLFDHAELIRTQGGSVNEAFKVELRLALEQAWNNYFPGPENLPFEMARMLMALQRPLEAARFNQISIDWFGEQPATYLNMGICYYYAENPDEALRCFERAKALNPEFRIPREWIARIRSERSRAASTLSAGLSPRISNAASSAAPLPATSPAMTAAADASAGRATADAIAEEHTRASVPVDPMATAKSTVGVEDRAADTVPDTAGSSATRPDVPTNADDASPS